MPDQMVGEARAGWRYHPLRDGLLAEAHARPYVPLAAPMLATRIATLSGESGAQADRAHMIALCRRLGSHEPSPGSRWCALDAGSWQLRWERHTEFSTWTFFRRPTGTVPFGESALDGVATDWLAALPGEVLVATRLELRQMADAPSPFALFGSEAIGSQILSGAAAVFTNFRPDAEGATRFLLLDEKGDAALAGRVALALLEIETYRLMALLAFPLAGEATGLLTRIEAEASALAAQLLQPADADQDRGLLARLAALAGEAEALSGRTTYRFGAASAYHDIVRDRIAALRESRIDGMQTLGEFMERRLAPALRTCDTVARRERAAIERIARTEQMLNTRVEVATEVTSAALLASMDRRADAQLQLQRTVEGLSVVAISYYAISIGGYLMRAIEHARPGFDPVLATGLMALPIIAVVWWSVRRIHARFAGGKGETGGRP